MTDLPAIETSLADFRFPPALPLARMLRESKLSSWLQKMTADPSNPRLWATISDKETCIGTVSLVEGVSPRTWWLSYWLSPTEWHKGFAGEAVGALLNSAARHGPYEQIVAAVARTNSPSIRLLERLGFTEASSTTTEQGIPEDHIAMGLWLRARGDA
jgi:RimJ/RimL family protein N-acetyltransferase